MDHPKTFLWMLPFALGSALLGCDRDIEGERGQDLQTDAEVASTYAPGWRWQWTDYDENRNELIERAEWDARFQERFRDFDLDRSEGLVDDEVRRGIYQWWDFDDTDYIEREDFDADFVRAIGVDERYYGFESWDRNLDGRIDETEFRRVWGETARFDAWDTNSDGVLTEQELGEGWFQGWDADRSGVLERGEGAFHGGRTGS